MPDSLYYGTKNISFPPSNKEDGPIESIQKESPQNEPFWHVDYFELKTIKVKKDLGIAFYLTLNCLKEFR